jgi:hypothetical protein
MNYIDEAHNELAKHIKVGKGLMRVYTLLVLVKGSGTTLQDVHDAWALNINETWAIQNPGLGDHYSLIPFDQLKPETAAKDQKFVDAIHAAARALKENHG